MDAKKTKRCPYCGGSGKQDRYYTDMIYTYPYAIRCVDCNGTGQRCILCCKPSVDCECPDSAFDGDYSEMDRPTTK
jgi:DnaJ-class molecular chaperone